MIGSPQKYLRVFLVILAVQAITQGVIALDYNIVHQDNALIQTYKALQFGSGNVAHHFVKVSGISENPTYELSQIITGSSGDKIGGSTSITVNSGPITFQSFLFDDSIGILYYNDADELKMKLFDLRGNFLRLITFHLPYLGETVALATELNGIASNDSNSINLVFLRISQKKEHGLIRLKYSLDGNLIETDTLLLGSTQVFNLSTIQNSRGQNAVLWTQKEPDSHMISIFVYNANSSLNATKALAQPLHYHLTTFLDAYYLPNGGLIALTAVAHPKGGLVTYLTFYDGYLSLASAVEINHVSDQEICNLFIFNSDKSGVLCSVPSQFPSKITVFSSSNSEVSVENVDPSIGFASFQQERGVVLSSEDDSGILSYSFIGEIRVSGVSCCPMQIKSVNSTGDFQISRIEKKENTFLKKLEVLVTEDFVEQSVNIFLEENAKVYAGIIPVTSRVSTDDLCSFIKLRNYQTSGFELNETTAMMFHYKESMSGYPGFITFNRLRPNTTYSLTVCATKNNRDSTLESLTMNFTTPYTGYRLEKVKLNFNNALSTNDLQKMLCNLNKELGLRENDTLLSVEGTYCQGKVADDSIDPSQNRTVTLIVQGNPAIGADNTTDLLLHRIFQQNALQSNPFRNSNNQAVEITSLEYLGTVNDVESDLLPRRVSYNAQNQTYEFELIVAKGSGYVYGVVVEELFSDEIEVCSDDLVTAFYHPENSRFGPRKVTRFSYEEGDELNLLLPAIKFGLYDSYFYYTATSENPSIYAAKTPVQYVVLKREKNAENKSVSDKSTDFKVTAPLVVVAVVFCFILIFCVARRFLDSDNERQGDFDDFAETIDEEGFESTRPIEVEKPSNFQEKKKDSRSLIAKSEPRSNQWREAEIMKSKSARQKQTAKDLEMAGGFTKSQENESAKVFVKKKVLEKEEEEKELTLDPADIDSVPKTWRDREGYQVFGSKGNDVIKNNLMHLG